MVELEALRATLEGELESLRDVGQELWLQAALMGAEVRSELHRLDERFQLVQQEIAKLRAQAGIDPEAIVNRLRVVLDELRNAYARLSREV